MKKSIDFIGIGAQKAGTTWLYRRLCELSEFSMPPIKEFHYFDDNGKYRPEHKVTQPLLRKRLKNINWSATTIKSLFGSILRGNFKKFEWLLNYYFANYDDDWYLSQFKSFKGITGDITPAYSILDVDDIGRMHRLLPKIKIIFLLRNPIDRTWSHFRHFQHIYQPDFDGKNGFIKFLDSYHLTLEKSNYLKSIENFIKYYSKSQILFGFYDAIEEQPASLLEGIVEFLGGDSSLVSKECLMFEKNNVSPKMKIPSEAHDILVKKYTPLIKYLSDKFGGYCTQWYMDLNNDTKTINKALSPGYTFLE